MIKAIFFDLDRTLLDSKKCIPQSAITVLKKCRNKGIKLFVATARTPDLVKSLNWNNEICSLFNGGVYCNGGINIINSLTEYNFIDREVINKIVKVMKKYPKINIALQSKDNVHAFNNPLSKSEISVWGVGFGKIFSTEEISYEEILKVLIFDGGFTTELKNISNEVINIILNVCGKLTRVYVTDEGRVIQIGSLSASKFNGVKSIVKKLNISEHEVAVFGDDINDLEMIKGFEISVAMGNAVNEIKESAKFITKRNDEDGIAFAIENLIGLI